MGKTHFCAKTKLRAIWLPVDPHPSATSLAPSGGALPAETLSGKRRPRLGAFACKASAAKKALSGERSAGRSAFQKAPAAAQRFSAQSSGAFWGELPWPKRFPESAGTCATLFLAQSSGGQKFFSGERSPGEALSGKNFWRPSGTSPGALRGRRLSGHVGGGRPGAAAEAQSFSGQKSAFCGALPRPKRSSGRASPRPALFRAKFRRPKTAFGGRSPAEALSGKHRPRPGAIPCKVPAAKERFQGGAPPAEALSRK